MKCQKCGKEVPEDELVQIRATADVTNVFAVTLKEFRMVGVAWEAHDSYDEEVKCPSCGEYTPVNPPLTDEERGEQLYQIVKDFKPKKGGES
jgi:ribosomal protein S26